MKKNWNSLILYIKLSHRSHREILLTAGLSKIIDHSQPWENNTNPKSGRPSVTPDLQEAANGPDPSPLLPPDELARLFVLHRVLKAVHRFGVLGTADIQRFPSGKIQQPLSLLRVKLAVDRKSTRLNSSHKVQSRMPSSA